MGSTGGVVGGKRLGVGSGCGDRLTGGTAQHRPCRAGAVSATADDRSRHVDFGRALAAGMRPDALDILLPAAGGRARRVEGAGLWSGPARACIGGAAAVGALRPRAVPSCVGGSATVEALRPAVTGVVADAGSVRGLGPGGGGAGATHALRSTRAA